MKIEYQKITDLLDTTFDKYLDLLLKNGLKFMIIQVVVMIDKNQTKKSMFTSDLRDYSDTYIVVKGIINCYRSQ